MSIYAMNNRTEETTLLFSALIADNVLVMSVEDAAEMDKMLEKHEDAYLADDYDSVTIFLGSEDAPVLFCGHLSNCYRMRNNTIELIKFNSEG